LPKFATIYQTLKKTKNVRHIYKRNLFQPALSCTQVLIE